MLTGQTCGMLVSFKFIEQALNFIGLNASINLGFLMLTSANFALWITVDRIINSSDFATLVFLSRFLSGLGSGLIDSACLISQTNQISDETEQDQSEMAKTIFRKHQAFIAAGNWVGPLLVTFGWKKLSELGLLRGLAYLTLLVWMLCALKMRFEP